MDAKISAMGDRIKVPLFANALIFCDWRAQESSVIGEGEKSSVKGECEKPRRGCLHRRSARGEKPKVPLLESAPVFR